MISPDSGSTGECSEAERFKSVVRDMFGRPVEGRRTTELSPGVEYLSAVPTEPNELFPDGYGSVTVRLPLPGYDEDKVSVLVTEYPEGVPEGRGRFTEKQTSIRVSAGQLILDAMSEKKEPYDPTSAVPFSYIDFDPKHTTKVVEGDSAHELVDWLTTLQPRPRRDEPISVYALGQFAEPSADPDDVVGELTATGDRAQRFVEAVTHKIRATDPRLQHEGGNYEYVIAEPPEEVREHTGAQDVVLSYARHDGQVPKGCFPLPHIRLESGTLSEPVTLYPNGEDVYVQRGSPPRDAEAYTVEFMGVTLMQGIYAARRGFAPTKLSPRQVEGVVALVQAAEPTYTFTRHSHNKGGVGSWSELGDTTA
jgi:hypothetical protein